MVHEAVVTWSSLLLLQRCLHALVFLFQCLEFRLDFGAACENGFGFVFCCGQLRVPVGGQDCPVRKSRAEDVVVSQETAHVVVRQAQRLAVSKRDLSALHRLAAHVVFPVAHGHAEALGNVGPPPEHLGALALADVLVVEVAELGGSAMPGAGDFQASRTVGQVDHVLRGHGFGLEPELANGDLERSPQRAEPLVQRARVLGGRDGVDASQHGLFDEVGQQLALLILGRRLGSRDAVPGFLSQLRFQ